MPFPNEHAARVVSPGKFQQDSFRRKKIDDGVSIIIGRLIGKTTTTTQSYRFDKDKFTAAEAKTWLKEHKVKPILFEPATEPQKKKKVAKEYLTHILKVDAEKRLVTGIVLEPEKFDSQDHIYSAEEVRKAAHGFLAGINQSTTTAIQHTDYSPKVEVVESYLTPVAMTVNKRKVKKGTWAITVFVKDDDVWAKVQAGELTGFSIKGVAMALPVDSKGKAVIADA